MTKKKKYSKFIPGPNCFGSKEENKEVSIVAEDHFSSSQRSTIEQQRKGQILKSTEFANTFNALNEESKQSLEALNNNNLKDRESLKGRYKSNSI